MKYKVLIAMLYSSTVLNVSDGNVESVPNIPITESENNARV